MHILHVVPYYAPHVGGVETHVQSINNIFIKAGHTVTVLTQQDELDQPLTAVQAGVTIIRIPRPVGSGLVTSWRYKTHFWQAIKSHHPLFAEADRVHVHDVFWWLIPVWWHIRSKLYITFHGWETVYPVRWQAKFQRWVANHLSQGSLHVGHWIKEFYWDRPTNVTYGGVFEEEIEAPQILSKPPKTLRFVFLGRLSKENEMTHYFELFKNLVAQGQLVDVTWVGDGEWRKECEKYGKVTGFVKNPEHYLKNAEVVGASSYLSLWQALANGKLVVAFYSHHLKRRYLETFPASKQMIVSSNPEQAAKYMLGILNDSSLWREIVTQAQAIVREHTWNKVARLYLDLWK